MQRPGKSIVGHLQSTGYENCKLIVLGCFQFEIDPTPLFDELLCRVCPEIGLATSPGVSGKPKSFSLTPWKTLFWVKQKV